MNWATLEQVQLPEDSWRGVDLHLEDHIGLNSDVLIEFEVIDHTANNASAAVDDFSIETAPRDPVTAGEAERSSLKLFPISGNPGSAELVPITFSLGRSGPVRLEIFDVQGHRVRSLPNQSKIVRLRFSGRRTAPPPPGAAASPAGPRKPAGVALSRPPR